MENKDLESKELVSLNSELSEFDLQNLEERLETDPLAVGGLLDVATTNDLSSLITTGEDCEKCGGLFVCNVKS